MTLGALDAALSAMPADAPVLFEDGRHPRGIGSWRGSYCEPAIDPGGTDPVTVEDVRGRLSDALNGHVFYGYKGGEYTYDADSPVNVDAWGEYTREVLIDVKARDGAAILVTKKDGE